MSEILTARQDSHGTVTGDIDNTIRWKQGERLSDYFEQRCDAVPQDHLAVIAEDAALTFRQLDDRANQTARFLIGRGVKPGDRVGVLFDKSVHGYVALLAIMKIGAAYVPLDQNFPSDRIQYIIDDAGLETIISVSSFECKLAEFSVNAIYLDAVTALVDARPASRLEGTEKPAPESDQLFYIIYTSGTTGKPKGVAIEHAGICNFVKVAGEVYGYSEDDRCYQGMTLAFDFHVEDLWTPLLHGATLIAGKSGAALFGADLHAFLTQHHVTILPCVPTLWATIEEDLPEVRIIQLSGEAVPHNLVAQWHRPGRRILNAYGPTECSVSSTLKTLVPGESVTIGVPLPTYTVVILDEHQPAEVAPGTIGEIGIAGVALARGYLNRGELTSQKFIADFLDLPNNPSHRIYRTGDYGRIRDDGELEFHGRLDTQVKLRGYRIELGEIETVLAQTPQIAQAVVHPRTTDTGSTELVAYYTRKRGAPEPSRTEVAENLRRHLPPYMVPGYLEELTFIPMTANNKADRKALPAPKGPRFSVSSSTGTAPQTNTEKALAEVLMDVMELEHVSVGDNFFQDLGAHSLLMAKFAGGIRQRMDVPAVSIRDIYLNPTIEGLATHVDALTSEGPAETMAASNRVDFHVPSKGDYWRCGALQLMGILAWSMFVLWLLITGIFWSYAAMPDLIETTARIVVFAAAVFVVLSLIPVVLKWLLIGKWKPEAIPIWSLRYFRFWVVKTALRVAPMALVNGPIRNLYLRLLGAKIGADTVIESSFPVATDLLSIGSGAILEKDSIVQGYKARSNYIHIGPIRIGDNVFIGEAGVVDINTVMEDDTQLGFASSLHEGQQIPHGKHFHGTPAVETAADYCVIDVRKCTPTRRWAYAVISMMAGLVVGAAPIVAVYAAFPVLMVYVEGLEAAVTGRGDVIGALGLMLVDSIVPFAVGTVLGLLGIGVIPRLLNLLLTADRTYVLYGFHYFIHTWIARISNAGFYNRLFGDSSAAVHYVRWLGYRMNTIIQTGSNFGMGQRHENPFLCDIGTGTMVSGGLKMINETKSSNAFKLSTVRVGEHNYLGNYLHFPANATVGDNVLLGTKALTPIDGPLRENTGLLGSPAFEIPRATARDLEMSRMDDATRARQLHAKNRYDLVTATLYLLNAWFVLFINATCVLAAVALLPHYGMVVAFVLGGTAFVTSALWMWFAERAVLKFGRMTPHTVPILNKYFWFHERTWKLATLSAIAGIFAGTPFKNLLSRMEGVRLGKMVFDDGTSFDEYTMIEIGHYANLNSHCVIQPHSLEEGVFKSGRVKVGEGCTLGIAANLHYDITLGDHVVIEQNSFVMKGETVEDGATWQGNPARLVSNRPSVPVGAVK